MSGFSFGTNQPATAAPTFGAPAATPAFGAPAGTSAFGAPAASVAPTFGGATAAPSFGTAAPSFGTATAAPSFGATAAAAPSFGSAAPTFGAPAASAAPTFGTTTFGAAPQATTFGAPARTTAAPTFGTPTLGAAAPSFGLGTTQATTTTTGLSFGNTSLGTAPTAGFGFGTAPTATTAATTTSAAAPTFGLGGGTSSFNFGAKPATNATTIGASLNFGTTTTTAAPSAFGQGSGLFGKPLTTSAPAPIAFVGLGGADIGSSHPKPGESKPDNIRVKETQVPDEIVKTVNNLKNHIKLQKACASDIGRSSTSKLTNVFNEISCLQWALQEISNTVQANYNQTKLLRKETNRTIKSVEMAQRTQDTPSGLQYENNQPFEFFQGIVAKYEQDLCTFREQIALTERHMRSLSNPQNISPADLKRGFQQLNESFISIAGRLHEIHQKVEQQKEQYLNLRKYRLRDATNVFEAIDNPAGCLDYNPNVSAGPTAFSAVTAMSNMNITMQTAGAGQTNATTMPLPK